MYPRPQEIEEVGNAFIALGFPEYTTPQQRFLTDFLQHYAKDLNEETLKETFKDKIETVDAVKVLHAFASHYHDEEEVLNEFNAEIEDLLILINGSYEGISI